MFPLRHIQVVVDQLLGLYIITPKTSSIDHQARIPRKDITP